MFLFSTDDRIITTQMSYVFKKYSKLTMGSGQICNGYILFVDTYIQRAGHCLLFSGRLDFSKSLGVSVSFSRDIMQFI